MALTARPLRVLVLSDGVAGHDRASDGIVCALEHLRAVEPVFLTVAEHSPWSRRLARLAAASAGHPSAYAAADWPDTADLVVSTGPATLAANIAAARWFRARNIYFGFPKRPLRGLSLLLSPLPSRHHLVRECPRPSRVDALHLPPPEPLNTPGPRRLALLFGGDSKHHIYTAEEMAGLGDHLRALLAAAPDWTLDVFDSRRSGPTFAILSDALKGVGGAHVHRFADGGLGSNADAFRADAVLVSADSLSMTHEALAAGRPTLVLSAAGYRPPRRDRAELSRMGETGQIQTVGFDHLTMQHVMGLRPPPRVSQPEALAALLRAEGF